MKKYITLFIILVITFTGCVYVLAQNSDTTTSEAYIPSETQTDSSQVELQTLDRNRLDSDDITVLTTYANDALNRMYAAHNIADGVRVLGYEETNPMITFAKKEYMIAQEDYYYYWEKIDKIKKAEESNKMTQKAAEYPAATQVWLYFKNKGYNDYVIAGLLGNFMAEVGGQTLNLQWWLNNGSYYGMAQWSKRYFPGVVGRDLQGQCDFIMSNIEATFKTYGKNYQSGFTYANWLSLTNEKQAALAFAKVYERCGSGSYSVRQSNATKALNYFVYN